MTNLCIQRPLVHKPPTHNFPDTIQSFGTLPNLQNTDAYYKFNSSKVTRKKNSTCIIIA